MHKTSEPLAKLQVKIDTTSQQHRGFAQVDNLIDCYGLGRPVKDTYRKVINLVRMCGGVCDWHMRRIAAYFHMEYETYRAHQRILKRVGLIAVVSRRIKGCRQNMANLLRLVVGVVKNNQDRKEKDLKTNTPAPAAAVSPPRREKSELQKLHEARFAQDRADSKWRRALYERKAAMLEKLAGFWSSKKVALERHVEAEREEKAYYDEHLEQVRQWKLKMEREGNSAYV